MVASWLTGMLALQWSLLAATPTCDSFAKQKLGALGEGNFKARALHVREASRGSVVENTMCLQRPGSGQEVKLLDDQASVENDVERRRASPGKSGGRWQSAEVLNESDHLGVEVDSPTCYANYVRACGNAEALNEGRCIHKNIVLSGHEQNRFLENLLIEMYGRCGALEEARSIFDKILRRNVYSWNLMIAAYVQQGYCKEALQLFQQMHLEGFKADKFTFLSCLSACADLELLAQGDVIHGNVVEGGLDFDVSVETALINVYAKCKKLQDAWRVFHRMHHHDLISWTALITAYAQYGHGQKAFQLFEQMQIQGVNPNHVTLVSVLVACASFAALEEGRLIHARIVEEGYGMQIVVGSALINMYSKCGSLEGASIIFDKMHQRNVVVWNAMIAAYAQHGHFKDSVQLFLDMEGDGLSPTQITFLNVLSACRHAGLVGEAFSFFVSMQEKHKIVPTMQHYGCMIDLLGRAGRLEEAEEFIQNMPFPPDSLAWEIMLGACRIYGDVRRGKIAAEHVMELDPQNAVPYVLLSNIHAAEGRWDLVAELRKRMNDRCLKKAAVCSTINVKSGLHEFIAKDTSHPDTEVVYAELKRLRGQMEEQGYVLDPKFSMFDMEEDMDEHQLFYHSEKLAIAFGLISTPPGTTLRIVRNLRICPDCHAATKVISKVAGREIMVRDTNRFHQFSNGACSCGDYW